MHDIKIIRKNPDSFKKKISERGTDIDVNKLLDLDKKNRDLIQNKEKFEQEKKIISQKKDKSQFKRSKEISLEIEKLNSSKIKKEVDSRTDKIEPESFSLNDLMGSVKSDNFSFIDMSAEDLSAKGNGGSRLMYNYCGLNESQKIYTPEEDYKPNKVDENEVKKYLYKKLS